MLKWIEYGSGYVITIHPIFYLLKGDYTPSSTIMCTAASSSSGIHTWSYCESLIATRSWRANREEFNGGYHTTVSV